MGQILSKKDSNSMKETPEPQDPLPDTPKLNEKYAITDEKFSELISQKEQLLTGYVVASSPIYSSNLVEDLKQKLKESVEVCDETMELQKSLSFLQLADEKEKTKLISTKVTKIQEEPDKNKALKEDVKNQFSKLLHVSNSLKEIEEKKTQLEEERAAIIEKHGEEVTTLKDLLAENTEELTTEDCRILSVVEATETLQPGMQSLKQRLDSYQKVIETAPQRTLEYYETTENVVSNCSTNSSIMEDTAEYNFEVAIPKSSTNLVHTITNTDVKVHSLHATGKSTLRPIAVGATYERPVAARTYQRKIRAREPEVEAIVPRAKRRKIVEPVEHYRCDNCGKTYRQYKSLSVHLKEDCGKPSVECENCRITYQPFSYRIHTKIGICSDARRRNISMRSMHNILHMLQEKLVTSSEVLRVDDIILLLRTHTCSIDHEHLATFFSKLHCFQKKNEIKQGLGVRKH